MEFDLFTCFILFAIVLQRRLSDAIPNVTLMGNDCFQVGDDLELTCKVNVDVDLLSVSFFKETTETIWINDPASCSFHKMIPDDAGRYNTTCDPSKTIITMTKYTLNSSDDKAVWSCQMKSKAGGPGPCVGANNPCISGKITLMLCDASDSNKGKPSSLTLGLGLGLGLGIPVVVGIIVIVILVIKKKRTKSGSDVSQKEVGKQMDEKDVLMPDEDRKPVAV